MAVSLNTNFDQSTLPQRLLALITEELKVPLERIARTGELAHLGATDSSVALNDISLICQTAIRLVDNYALGLKLVNFEPGTLELEPVAASSVLAEVIAELEPLAASHGIKLELELYGRHLPVIANARALAAAMSSAGASLLEVISSKYGSDYQTSLKLCLHHGRGVAEAGWYWSGSEIDAEVLRRGWALLGRSRQPLAPNLSGQASGIFIADLLLESMNSKLKSSKFHNLTGLAASLKPSSQLVLV